RREEIEKFQRSMWLRDGVSKFMGRYLELAVALPPPAMIYVETADGGREGFAGERLLHDARLMVVSGNLVLRIDGSDYVVADVSRAPLLDNRGLGGPPLSPVPGMVVNPAFVRWRQRAIAWQQERLNRQLQFLAACSTIRLDSLIGHEADIELDRTVE